jgi:DNA (cytosine-5)-methyltransferase 1
MAKLRALGITDGIGSMLIGARNLGFEIVGNFEWRKYYYKKDEQGQNTFLKNFPGAFMRPGYPQDDQKVLASLGKIDVVFSHPECGAFSALNFSNKNYKEKQLGCADIPLAIEAIAAVKPRFFFMDDLPRSFLGFPMSEYHQRLPDYDLFPEWISNYHYGNVQLNRKRMFMIGALKSERWAFVPGERAHDTTVKDIIGDLRKKNAVPNHHPHVLDDPCGKVADFFHYGYRGTWRDFQKVMSERPEGPPIPYIKQDGSEGVRMGTAKVRWEGHGFVLDGGSVCTHPITNLPLSIRERARIQGFPDDFIFYGIKLDSKGRWDHDKNNDLVKQTGKAMPIQFCTYAAELVKGIAKTTNERFIEPNGLVTDAKRWYCENVGYSNQKAACDACWCRQYCSLERFTGTRTALPPVVSKSVVARVTRMAKAPKVVETKERDTKRGQVFGSFSN